MAEKKKEEVRKLICTCPCNRQTYKCMPKFYECMILYGRRNEETCLIVEAWHMDNSGIASRDNDQPA